MPLTAGLGRRMRMLVNGLGVAVTLAVLALALHNAGLLGGHSLNGLFSKWVYNGAEAAIVGMVLARAALISHERTAWLLLAIGIACFTAGDVLFTLTAEGSGSAPTPSLSDACYLLFYPCALAMLVSLVGGHVRDLHLSVWIDGAICALTVAAVGAALVLDPVLHSSHGSGAGVAANLAYPLADLVLIIFAFGIFALTGWRPGRTWLLIALGFAAMAGTDSFYLFEVAEGAYRAGTILDAMWPAGLLLMGLAAWSTPRPQERSRLEGVAMMIVPCLFGAVALFLLIRANYVHLSPVPEALAGAALLAAGLRFGMTFTEVRRLSELRDRQARTDYLTGLANRRRFYEQLNETIDACRRRGSSFALLTIDLDRFKELNDTLGHYAGDMLLSQIGPRLQEVLGEVEVARLGGDEFGLVLRDASVAAHTAGLIHRALGRPFLLDDLTVSVHASVGIAIFPEDSQSTEGLLRRADVAMYQAKEQRSRYAFYVPSRDSNSIERLGLISDLKEAIEQGGLIVHYQPQVDLRSRAIVGVEALVRWQHPRRGLLGAEEFVAMAEQTGVMRELTASVLEQSLAQQRAWIEQGHELKLSVNVSATSLLDASFLEDLRRRLERWRTPPGMLRLEITESTLIAEGSRVQKVIESLGDLGVELSLDDFGTGYSPLSYLRELPVTELKIDRSFVTAMMDDQDTATIVSSVIDLARRLGIAVVAEGVETKAQAQMLRSFDCPLAQGYLFSRPLAAQTLARWLREGTPGERAEDERRSAEEQRHEREPARRPRPAARPARGTRRPRSGTPT